MSTKGKGKGKGVGNGKVYSGAEKDVCEDPTAQEEPEHEQILMPPGLRKNVAASE